MNSLMIKGTLAILFSILSIALGFYLTANGQPYNQTIGTIHKVASLFGAIAFGVLIYSITKRGLATPTIWTILVLCFISFFFSMYTGAILINRDEPHTMILILHRVLPALTFIFGIGAFRLLMRR